jgi:hypothetical protein
MSNISAVHGKPNPVQAVAQQPSQTPHPASTQAASSGSSSQDSVTISPAGLQAANGQATDAAKAMQAAHTYPTYQAHPPKAR